MTAQTLCHALADRYDQAAQHFQLAGFRLEASARGLRAGSMGVVEDALTEAIGAINQALTLVDSDFTPQPEGE